MDNKAFDKQPNDTDTISADPTTAQPSPQLIPNQAPTQQANSPEGLNTSSTSSTIRPAISRNFTPTYPAGTQPQTTSQMFATKKKRGLRLRHMLPIVVLILIGGGVAYATLTTSKRADKQTNNLAVIATGITRSYDSPIGLLPDFQNESVRSGQFEITYKPHGTEISRKGDFVVDESGHIYFDMLENPAKTDELIDFLVSKSSEHTHLSDTHEYLSYDFASLIGYDYLYDPSRIFFGNYFQVIEEATRDNDSTYYNIGTLCTDALNAAKQKTNSKWLNTVTLEPTITETDGSYAVAINQDVINQSNQAVENFYDSCFDLSRPSLIEHKTQVEQTKNNKPKMSPVTFVQHQDKTWRMDIGDGDRKISITILKTSSQPITGKESVTGSAFTRLHNMYGLMYDFCRMPPVVTSDFMGSLSYNFLVESRSYYYPSELDSGYYCAPSQTPGRYRPDRFMRLNLPGVAEVSGNEADFIMPFVAHTEIRYAAESLYKRSGTYPSRQEMINEVTKNNAANKDVLTEAEKHYGAYKLLPDDCTDKCKDFTTSITLEGAIISSSSYNSTKSQ